MCSRRVARVDEREGVSVGLVEIDGRKCARRCARGCRFLDRSADGDALRRRIDLEALEEQASVPVLLVRLIADTLPAYQERTIRREFQERAHLSAGLRAVDQDLAADALAIGIEGLHEEAGFAAVGSVPGHHEAAVRQYADHGAALDPFRAAVDAHLRADPRAVDVEELHEDAGIVLVSLSRTLARPG